MASKGTHSKREPKQEPAPSSTRDVFGTKDPAPAHESYRESKDKMSRSQTQQPTTFADVAVSYRIYILDDLLAEPQEIVHDWYRGLLYISQRHRQGNSFAPIEMSHEVSVFDISTGDIASVDIAPYTGPHCMEMVDNCAYLHAHVNGGGIWIDPESRTVANFEPAEKRRRAHSTSEDFIAEVDLRSGKMRQRVNVPEQSDRNATDGRHVAFSAPAIRFASRSSSSGMPVVDVGNDAIIEAIKAKFAAVKTIYVTSRNVMLV